MSRDTLRSETTRAPYVGKIAPGLAKLLNYQRSDLPHDPLAGLSVAAVALPVGVAYAQLAGFNPAVGYGRKIPIYPTLREVINAYRGGEAASTGVHPIGGAND